MDHLFGGGGISFRISIDPDVESASPDSIIRSESAKNDFFSKRRLHSLYVMEGKQGLCSGQSASPGGLYQDRQPMQ